MTPEETQVLSVLDAIERDNGASQRDLSRATGLNLAKVNFLLRKLAEKGHLKLRNVSVNPNKLRYLYILTPHGIAEKSRLTMSFVQRTLAQYGEILERLRHSLERLVALGGRRVVLLGDNEVADMVIEAAAGVEGIEIVAIVDPAHKSGERRGLGIVPSFEGLAFDRVIPCDEAGPSAAEVAGRTGVEEERIWLV
jgi:MarR family transcriptional regulator, temperature-dependent positive regulator of motility